MSNVLRTKDQIKSLLELAKLDESQSAGVCQTVNFAPTLDSNQYKVFEMPNSLVADLVKPGSQISVELKDEPKADHSGRVFATTLDQTFAVVEAETSNTLLFASDWWLPSMDCDKENAVRVMPIQMMKTNYFEFKSCAVPSLRMLRQLLLPSMYFGPIEDDIYLETKATTTLIDRQLIDNQFPCSSVDLSRAFYRLRICELGGKVRLLDCEYLTQMIRDLFALADENAWDWRNYGFPLDAAIDGLKTTHNVDVIKQAIGLFFAQRTGPYCSNFQELYVFPCVSKICQVIGEHLLAVTHSFDLSDFLSLWKASVPNGLRPKLRRHLTCSGRAIVQSTISLRPNEVINFENLRFKSISLLRSEDLPDDTVEHRFKTLFERCSVWPEAELAGYIDELIPSDAADCFPSNLRAVRLKDHGVVDILYSDRDSDSDFEYDDLTEEVADSCVLLAADQPKPIASRVSAVLNKCCRASACSSGRMFTSRH